VHRRRFAHHCGVLSDREYEVSCTGCATCIERDRALVASSLIGMAFNLSATLIRL
jgi:hypothetical protein